MLYKNRLIALRTAMQDEAVDMVALGPGAHLAWLTGVKPHTDERPLLLCITQSYAGFLMPELESESARQQTQELPFHTWSDAQGPVNALQECLATAKAGDARSIVLDETMRADFAALVQDELPGASRQFTATTIGALRMRKDNNEYEILKRNALIADKAMQKAWSEMRIGMTENDVAAIVRESFKSHDAEPLFHIIGAGANGAFPHHHTGDTTLAQGDIVVMDIGGGQQGYSSDITRMASMGKPPADYEKIHMIVEVAVQAAMAAARPGVKAHVVDDAARKVITDAGYGELFMHRTGHGMGVEIHETPYITSTSQTILEEGMVFSIEPGIYQAGKYGLRLEDIVILRTDGPEIFSELSRELYIVG